MTVGMEVSAEVVVEIRRKDIEQVGPEDGSCRCARGIEVQTLREQRPVGVREIVQFQEAVSERPPELSERLLPVGNRAGQSCPSGIDRERTIEQPAGAQILLKWGKIPKSSQIAGECARTGGVNAEQEAKSGGKIEAQGSLPVLARNGNDTDRALVEERREGAIDAHRSITLDLDAPDGAREGRQPSHGRRECCDSFGAFNSVLRRKRNIDHSCLPTAGGSFDASATSIPSGQARRQETANRAQRDEAAGYPDAVRQHMDALETQAKLAGKIVSGPLLGEIHQEHIKQVTVVTETTPLFGVASHVIDRAGPNG